MKDNEERSDSAQRAAWAHGPRSARPRGTVPLIAVVAAAALALSACGGGSTNSQGVAALPSTTTQPEAPGGRPPAAKEWRGLGPRRRRALRLEAL